MAHPLYPEGKGCANERNESSLSYCRVQPTFSMRKRGLGKAVDPPLRLREDWWVFEKTLNAKEVFRKPHFKADLQKNKAYFLIVSKKYQNLIRNPT